MSHFIFEHQEFLVDPEQCFLIMPFKASLHNVYDVIENTVQNQCGLKCKRPDKMSGSKRITNDIWIAINESIFVIADLTDLNPNVFYEVGLAHALKKPVILIGQNPETDIPFDVKGIRYFHYDSENLDELAKVLPNYIKAALSTFPTKWNRNSLPTGWSGSYIIITSVNAPTIVSMNQPFEITICARNNGADARQGYFSVSFPSKVENVEIIDTNASKKLGQKGDPWKTHNSIVTLNYPIAEGFRYSKDNPSWRRGKEYFIKVRAYPKQKGLLRFFVSASSMDNASGKRQWDPFDKILDLDQRNQPVYSGVINVV